MKLFREGVKESRGVVHNDAPGMPGGAFKPMVMELTFAILVINAP
jgi:hypothetical protein